MTLISSEGDPNAIDDELTITAWCFSTDIWNGCPLLTKSREGVRSCGRHSHPDRQPGGSTNGLPDKGSSLGVVVEEADAVCCR
jgi:hypothetical protein